MTDSERAMGLYECALRHNPYSVTALSSIASLCRSKEQFGKVFAHCLLVYEKRLLTCLSIGNRIL